MHDRHREVAGITGRLHIGAVFENAPVLDEPLSPEEEELAREALGSGDEGISTAELLKRLRPKG